MSRTDEMRSLVEQLLADRAARNTAVATLRMDTSDFLHTVQDSHTIMALKQAKRAVVNRRQMAATRHRMAKDVTAFRKNTQAAHQATAQALNAQLTTDRASLAAETATFLQDVQKAQATMAKAQTEQLAANHASVQAATAQMVEETSAFIHTIQANHATIAQTQAKKLATDRMELATETAQVLKNAADLLGKIQADTTNAAATWRMMSAMLSGKDAKAQEAAKAAEPVSSLSGSGVDGKEDLLSNLRGIGLTTQGRLYAAGITTYAQLAAATPEEIRTAIGPSIARLSNPVDWIEQAKQMMDGG